MFELVDKGIKLDSSRLFTLILQIYFVLIPFCTMKKYKKGFKGTPRWMMGTRDAQGQKVNNALNSSIEKIRVNQECFDDYGNHVAKRLGTRLRALRKKYELGGRGKLTNQIPQRPSTTGNTTLETVHSNRHLLVHLTDLLHSHRLQLILIFFFTLSFHNHLLI